jgi:hypothetical protein
MATPNLFDKACMFSGIDQPSSVYVDIKKDNAVKSPLSLLIDFARLASKALAEARIGEDARAKILHDNAAAMMSRPAKVAQRETVAA